MAVKKGEIRESGSKQLWDKDGIVFLIKLMDKFDLLVKVSKEWTLAYALGMTGSEVDRCFTNHQYNISNISERVAYKKLCDTLEKVQMNALIYQALV